MSVTSGTYGQAPDDGSPRRYQCHGLGWKPIELVAMILGFIVFWPIGLAILLGKIWQSRSAYAGDLPSFLQTKIQQKFQEKWERKMGRWACGYQDAWGVRRRDFADWSRNWSMRSSGNLAFDDWRSAELARLEEEREKLRAAEREFADFIDNLRRAKDREEFDRFMASRTTRPNNPSSPDHPAA